MPIERLTSDLLGDAQHGFFTRKGGVSSGIFDSLNCGPGSTDQREAVIMNRARVATAMDVDAGLLLSLDQVHSPDVVVATAQGWTDRPRADGMVTNTPGVALGVLTADCAPVLFSDATAGVVGACHSGWKGAIGGVVEATLTAMEGLGATRAHIRAAIGPTISQRAYEVGPEFFDQFTLDETDNARFFANGMGDRFQFDLPGFILERLRTAGLEHMEWTGHCTYSDPSRFFSYRRATHMAEVDYGRLISVIRV